ncbi:transglycosylase SLT domain-containing protein [Nocardia sp. NPDC050412]|uniref:aggregation-promoting factor C-terminal-like domain-containing protein n=1 Tax=unclassified Nocardia TaxID=2637762 RepID=UPI0037AA42CB
MLRVAAAAIAVGALMVCAGPAVAEGLGDSVVTFANAPNSAPISADGPGDSTTTPTDGLSHSATTSADDLNDGATTLPEGVATQATPPVSNPNSGVPTSANGLNGNASANAADSSAITPAHGPGDNAATTADTPDNAITPADAPDSPITPADGPGERVTPSADSWDDSVTTSTDGLDDALATPVEESDDDTAVTPAASSHDTVTTTVGLAASLIRLGTRALALTVVPLHQFPAFDAVITHESGWDVFAINPKSGAYGLGQALPAEKMQTHGADWRINPLTQIRWTYDYMNDRYGSPDGAWAFWQQHHWY